MRNKNIKFRRLKTLALFGSLLVFMSAQNSCSDTASNVYRAGKKATSYVGKKLKESATAVQKMLTPKQEEDLSHGDLEGIVENVGVPVGGKPDCNPYDVQNNNFGNNYGYTYDYETAPKYGEYAKTFTPGDQNALAKAFVSMGGDIKALDQAQCAIKQNLGRKFKSMGGGKMKIKDDCQAIIGDYNKHKSLPRLFMVDKCKGTIHRGYTAEGFNGVAKAGKAGNYASSNMTPRGMMIMGGDHYGSNKSIKWYPGIKMHGIQRGVNTANTGTRGVVFHRAIGSKSGRYYVDGNGAHGNSAGCTAVSQSTWDLAVREFKGSNPKKSNGNVGSGPLMYNYTSVEKAKPAGYCGEKLWL